MGEQDSHAANMGGALDLLHQKIAGTHTILYNHGKIMAFEKAALLAQETAAAEDEGESQAILFAMLQEQHDKQIAAMTATNKANMNAMMERMNSLVTGGGGRCPNNQIN
jgi:hypothetical protein